MEHELDLLMQQFLSSYPKALGASFHSLVLPVKKSVGTHLDILEKYKDIPVVSVNSSFNTSFSFIITERGSIVIFFIDNSHFVSVFTESREPNKELAKRMHQNFCEKFETLKIRQNET